MTGTRPILAAALLVMMSAMVSGCGNRATAQDSARVPAAKETTKTMNDVTIAPLNSAASQALAFLKAQGQDPTKFRLVRGENMLSGEGASPTRWRFSFKRASLIPAQPGGLIGKGGELVVEVDTHEGTSRWVSRGD